MQTRAIHADTLVTGDREPIADGAVVVDEAGVIVDVGPAAEILPRHAGLKIERLAGVVMPGLVNAHTHLELSALHGQVRGGAGFVPWVEGLIGARAELADGEATFSTEGAVGGLGATGTVAVGEVTNTLGAVRELSAAGFAGCVFHEAFGLRRGPVMGAIGELAHGRDRWAEVWQQGDLAYGPAPHTLYTTHPDAVRALLALARERGARSSLHLAEHPGERRALERGDGPVVDWLEDRMKLADGEVTWPRRGPIDFAADLGALAPDVLLVHLTDASAEELGKVAASGAPVVLCPRSNLFIEVKLPPLLAMRAAGIEPALGTDSLASNASLDVLAEARALGDRFSTVPAWELLRMATWNGARALGRPDLGRIAVGARPGLFGIEGPVGQDGCAFALRSLRRPRRWLVTREAPAGGPS